MPQDATLMGAQGAIGKRIDYYQFHTYSCNLEIF